MNTLVHDVKIQPHRGRERDTKTLVIKTRDLASDIWFDNDHIFVRLTNGVEISTSLKYFPRLMNANPDQRNKWELIGKGVGIYWEEIDEDISIKTLLRYSDHPNRLAKDTFY